MKNEWESLNDGRIVVWLNSPERLGGKIRLFSTISESSFDAVDETSGTWNGHYNSDTGKWYARIDSYGSDAKALGKRRIRYYIHRRVLGLYDSRTHGDHKLIPDTLNNTLENLRSATPSENAMNVVVDTEYGRGVWKANDKFAARANISGESQHLGVFDTERDARLVVEIVNRLFNPFAITEEIPSDAIWIPDSRSIFPIVPDHIYEKAGVLHLKPTLHTEPTLEASRV